MSRDPFLLVHPDDEQRIKEAIGKVPELEALRVEVDKLGACERGHGFMISLPDPIFPRRPPPLSDWAKLLQDEISRGFQVPASMLYGPQLAMPKLSMHVGIDLATEPDWGACYVVSLSSKGVARKNRRHGYQSNVRRRKRWAELRKRGQKERP